VEVTVKPSISLTGEQEAYARSLVERGRYSSRRAAADGVSHRDSITPAS
jgi:hypothetical protein